MRELTADDLIRLAHKRGRALNRQQANRLARQLAKVFFSLPTPFF